jgi:lipopolysaccharide export system permease protein
MTKNNELVALKSSGISIYYFLIPVILLGIIFSAFLFFLSEVIVPVSMEHANRIWLKDVRKESAVMSKEKDIWIKGNRIITHIKHYNSANEAILGITINYFDIDFRLIRRIDAKKSVFIQDRWHLYDVAQQNLNKKDNNYKISFHEKIIEKLHKLQGGPLCQDSLSFCLHYYVHDRHRHCCKRKNQGRSARYHCMRHRDSISLLDLL